MNQPSLLPGSSFGPSPAQVPPSASPAGWFRVLLTIWLLAGLALLVWKLGSSVPNPGASSSKTAAELRRPPVTAISIEDLLHHLDTGNSKLLGATERIRRAQVQITRTLPSIERNYLLVEKQRLDAALADSEIARRGLEESRQEFELVLNSLRKDQQLQ